jgi:hypothetical protein
VKSLRGWLADMYRDTAWVLRRAYRNTRNK